MAHYLIVANMINTADGSALSAPEVYETMIDHNCWEFAPTAPHLDKITKDDVLFFYLGAENARYIAGEALVAGDLAEIDQNAPSTFAKRKVSIFTKRLPLKEIVKYKAGHVGPTVMKKLSFVKSSTVPEKYFGVHLKDGICALDKNDAQVIRDAAGITEKPE
ncbi:MAG: hypothetical protein RDV48_02615 [Candidatus Eremiobacteraeota bacterium]|nr:hypothetical protein [Candidatus Eremiobacteraeota bacterium]